MKKQDQTIYFKCSRIYASMILLVFLFATFTKVYAQVWNYTGSIVNTRVANSATLISDTTVLIAGGHNGGWGIPFKGNTNGFVNPCEIYHIPNGSFTNTGNLNLKRFYHSAVLLNNGKVLVVGGTNAYNVFTNTCELYDPSTGSWSYTGSMSVDRIFNTTTLLTDGKVLVTGGMDGSQNMLNTCEIYDPSTETWSTTGSMPVGVYTHAATLLKNGQVLVTGGNTSNSGNSVIGNCQLYDPGAGTWTATASLNFKRSSHTANLLNNGKVLIIGGEDKAALSSCELYNPSTGTWSVTGSLNTASHGHTTMKLNNGMVLISGGNYYPGPNWSDNFLMRSELYDTGSGLWQYTHSMNTVRYNHNATLLPDGSVFISTGLLNPSTIHTSNEIYTSPWFCSGQPQVTNTFTGNITISTQTQLNQFYNSVNDQKWTEIVGNITLNGNDASDPITNLCNLSEIKEVSGHFLIQQFSKSFNPRSLSLLYNLLKVGRLTVITNPSFELIKLVNLSETSGSIFIRNNQNVKIIHFPKLTKVGGGQFHFSRNSRAELIKVSDEVSNFSFTNNTEPSNVAIYENGDKTSHNLIMDFNKLTVVAKDFHFYNNSNTGINNFDNIFSSLDTVFGKLIITNNTSLANCCIAASAAVLGGRTIYNNTGNCADLSTVSNYCGALHKRSSMLNTSTYNDNVEFKVYPNPSNGIFNIEIMSHQNGLLYITITDVTGRIILSEKEAIGQDTVLPVSLTAAANGTYFLKAELNGNVFSKRVVIIK